MVEVREVGPRGASVLNAQAQTLPRNRTIKQKIYNPRCGEEEAKQSSDAFKALALSLVRPGRDVHSHFCAVLTDELNTGFFHCGFPGKKKNINQTE